MPLVVKSRCAVLPDRLFPLGTGGPITYLPKDYCKFRNLCKHSKHSRPGCPCDDGIQILSIPVRLRRSAQPIRMLITGTDPFATAKPDARLVKLLIRAHRLNATLLDSDGVPFAALAKRQGVSPSYFTRLVRLSYLAPDITEAILDGRQPRDLTADKLLAHSRLPLTWDEQRAVLGIARAGQTQPGHIAKSRATRRRLSLIHI